MGMKLYLFLSWTHDLSVIVFILQILWASLGITFARHPFFATTLYDHDVLFRRLFAFLVVAIFSSGIVLAAFSPLTLAHPLSLIKIMGMLLAVGLALAAFNTDRTQQSRVLFLSGSIVMIIVLVLVSMTDIFGI